MDSRQAKRQALEKARLALAKLEEQAAGYTSLTIPVDLFISLDEKRKEVLHLEAGLAGKDADPFPNTLPRQEPFFGREKEKARALEALAPQDRGWGVVIDGIGGIGKTALAVEIAFICRDHNLFDVFLFTTAKQTVLEADGERQILGAAATLKDMVRDVARALGKKDVSQFAGTESQEGLLDVLKDFSGPARRVLLIFDNLETLTPDEQREMVAFLRRLPQECKAIITSRRRIGDGAVWLPLDKLEWEAALQMISEAMRRAPNLKNILLHEGESRWQELYDAVGGSPLALQWMLGLMRLRNLSLDRALEILRKGAVNDSALYEFIFREARKEMKADDLRVLCALSLFSAEVSAGALARIVNCTPLALESILERLRIFSLVNEHGPGGPFSLNPLTRRFAKDELSAHSDLEQELQRRFAEYSASAPPRSEVFLGREDALLDLKRLLGITSLGRSSTKNTSILLLRGWPGVGKTTLATALASDVETVKAFPDGVLWASLGQSPMLIQEMAAWGRALGSEEILRAPTLKDATARLADLLRHKRLLMVVDYVWESEHAIPFVQAGGKECVLLITTRLSSVADALAPTHESIYNLPALTEERALELLALLAPTVVTQYPDECRQLVRVLESLPLALHVAGRMLNEEVSLGWGVADLLKELREGKALIVAKAPADLVDLEKGTIPTIAALLRKSTDRLDDFTRKCFAYLAPFAPMPATFDLEALKVVWDVEDPKPVVRELIARGLLESVSSGRFQIHAILVQHAKLLLTTWVEKKKPLTRHNASIQHAKLYLQVLHRANDLYKAGGERITEGLSLFDSEWGNIQVGQAWAKVNAVDNDEYAELCIDYSKVGAYLIDLRLHPQERIIWLEAALTATRSLNKKHEESVSLINLGLAYADLSELRLAMSCYEQALEIARVEGSLNSEGAALGNLGLVYSELGEYPRAIELYEQQLAISKELGDRRSEGSALGSLGNAYYSLGNIESAIESHERRLVIAREIGDRRGEEVTLANLGVIYYSSGHIHRAIEFHEQAISIARELGDRLLEGNAFANLGLAHAAMGDASIAMEHYEQALEIHRTTGYRLGEAITLSNLGIVTADLGNEQQAIEFQQQAAAIYRSIGNRRGEADTFWYLSLAFEKIGNRDQAIAYAEIAHNIREEIGDPNASRTRDKLIEWRGN